MAGWDYYVLDMNQIPDVDAKLSQLQKLGEQSWEMVAVCGDVAYFKRYASYADMLRPNVAAEGNADPLYRWVADESKGQKRIESITSQDSGPSGAMHTHRVMVIVDANMVVLRGGTDAVAGHSHTVTMVGSVDESDGHTHSFSIQ